MKPSTGKLYDGAKAIYWRLFIARLSLRWTRQLNVGDEVIFNGLRYTLNNGVNDPLWSLVREGDWLQAHRDQFRKVLGARAAWRSFRSGYQFYMRSWYDIWKRQGIQPWMRGCRIWAGKAPPTRCHD